MTKHVTGQQFCKQRKGDPEDYRGRPVDTADLIRMGKCMCGAFTARAWRGVESERPYRGSVAHSEGYDDTFKQAFRRFYQALQDPGARPIRSFMAFESDAKRAWVDVPPMA